MLPSVIQGAAAILWVSYRSRGRFRHGLPVRLFHFSRRHSFSYSAFFFICRLTQASLYARFTAVYTGSLYRD